MVRGKLKGATGVRYKRTRVLPTNYSFEENFRDNSVFQLAIAWNTYSHFTKCSILATTESAISQNNEICSRHTRAHMQLVAVWDKSGTRGPSPGATIPVVTAHAHPRCAFNKFQCLKKVLWKDVEEPQINRCNYASVRWYRSVALREQNTVCWVCKQVLIKWKGVPERVCRRLL